MSPVTCHSVCHTSLVNMTLIDRYLATLSYFYKLKIALLKVSIAFHLRIENEIKKRVFILKVM